MRRGPLGIITILPKAPTNPAAASLAKSRQSLNDLRAASWVLVVAAGVGALAANQARDAAQVFGTECLREGGAAKEERWPTFLRPFLPTPGGMGGARPRIERTVELGTIGLACSRAYSTAIRRNRVETLAEQMGADKVVDLAKVMVVLRDLEILDKLKGRQPKSGNGYKEAARSLYPLWHTVDSAKDKVPITFEQLQDALDPLQSHAWAAISELLLTGGVGRLDDLTKQEKAAILFLQVHGFGVKFAEKFIAMGATSLKDLEDLPLSRAQKIGLRHVEDIGRLIPRSEMEKLRQKLEECVLTADSRFECSILGSYRRGVDFSSDIDLVVRHKLYNADNPDLSKALLTKVVDALTAKKLIKPEDMLTNGAKKYSLTKELLPKGLIKLPRHKHYRRIDIRLAPYDLFPYMQLGSSGDALLMKVEQVRKVARKKTDALLMKLLRHTAKGRGLTLNEYGMGQKYGKEDENPNGFKPDTLRVVKDEREIFEILGLPYLEPTERDYSNWKVIYKAAGVDLDYVEKL
ncbi:hypothetical protein P7C70_g1357, partial [Phenoliferia sp. Uapishka_3]